MPFDLLRKLERRARFHLGLPPLKESVRFRGRDLDVYEGVVGDKAEKDTAWTFELARRAKVLLDVGANIGQTAVLALAAGVETVAVVEAEPSALVLCVENVITNFPSATFFPVLCFASDRDEGTTTLFRYRHGAANSMFASHAVTAAKKGSTVEVPNRTLDGIVDDLGIEPDLVKIDIEGAEQLALAGATKLVARCKPSIIVEMHSGPELSMTDNCEAVLRWCEEQQYEAYYLAEHLQLQTPAPLSHRGRCHLLLLPESTEYPDYLRGIAQGSALPE